MTGRKMKIKKSVVGFLLALLFTNSYAINDTIILNSEIYSEKISADLDSLVNSWYVRLAMQ